MQPYQDNTDGISINLDKMVYLLTTHARMYTHDTVACWHYENNECDIGDEKISNESCDIHDNPDVWAFCAASLLGLFSWTT